MRLCSAADSQIKQSNAGKVFEILQRKTLGQVISIFQNPLIQFIKLLWTQLGNKNPLGK